MNIMDARANERVRVAIVALGIVTLAALVASCASTEMTSTWTDPAAKGAALSKVAVVCMTKDAGLRRIAEDKTAANLAGAKAIPSYQILGDMDLKDLDAVKSKLQAAGIHAVLVMRITGVSEQVTDVGGPYGTFDGYWGYAAGAAYGPMGLQTEPVVHMVSNLYSLDQNKLIWSGVSKNFDPTSANAFITDVSKAVAKSLEKERLVL
jgi:hypothetical protein